MTALDSCKLKVSIEKYMLALTIKLMHRSMKHHFHWWGLTSITKHNNDED